MRISTQGLRVIALCVAGVCQAADRNVFPDPARAGDDLASALRIAAAAHRRIIVDFGGNWCPDCRTLDGWLHDAVNQPILAASYVLVHVNVGRLDKNLDLAARFQIPLDKGVPALAVLDSDGALLYSQRLGEYQDTRRLDSASVSRLLQRWQPAPE